MNAEQDQLTPDSLSPKSSQRSTLIKFVQRFLAIISVCFVIFSLIKDRTILEQAKNIPRRDVGLTLALLTIYFILHAQRFVLLIEQHCRCRIPLLDWIRMLLVMRFMNNVVPQTGSIYRGITLKRDYGISYTDFIAANIFFIWTDTILNFFIALLFFILGTSQLEIFRTSAVNILILGIITLIAAPFTARALIKRISSPSKFLNKLGQIVDELFRGIKQPRYIAVTTFIALISFLLMTEIFQILLGAIGAEIDLATLGVFYALYRLTFHINITPGNLGIREIAYGLLCAGAQIGMAKGLLISAELRILSVIMLIMVALAVASRELKEAWKRTRRGSERSN
jgi:uncharacterized membrane protein YbhN (UPF0104 family)